MAPEAPALAGAGAAERAALAARLQALAADLGRAPATVAVPLTAVGDAARRDAAEAAAARGVPVAVDVGVPDGVLVPCDDAGALVDALGRVLRDAVRHGTPRGGAIRVVAHTERDVLVVVAGDRGVGDDPGAGADEVHPDRMRGLHAAAGCLATAGGEMSVGIGPWGGLSVTLRLPLG